MCAPFLLYLYAYGVAERERVDDEGEREKGRDRASRMRGDDGWVWRGGWEEIKMMGDARPPSFIVCVVACLARAGPLSFLCNIRCPAMKMRRNRQLSRRPSHAHSLHSRKGGHPPSPVRARPPRGRLLSRTHASRPPLAPRGQRRPRLCRRRVRHVRLVHGDPPPPPGRRRPDSQAAEPAHHRVRTPPPVARAACPRRPLPREQAEAGGEAERPLEVVDEGPD